MCGRADTSANLKQTIFARRGSFVEAIITVRACSAVTDQTNVVCFFTSERIKHTQMKSIGTAFHLTHPEIVQG